MYESPNDNAVEAAYKAAAERYALIGVDTNAVLKLLATIPVSIHCWQGDDVAGFESDAGLKGGGIQTTGNYPGAARTPGELRADYEKALSLVPGRHRVSIHAIYAETGGKVDRDALEPKHFSGWIDWAKANGLGMDFNGTFFSHPKAAAGYTLSSADAGIRGFWVDHGIACRKIGAHMGRELGTACVTNVWIPDGTKDNPVDRMGPRERLAGSLDTMFAERLDQATHLDAVESKLFGIGSESYVVGSHEFYLGYVADRKNALICLDMGHFHPTEQIADKISAVLLWTPGLLLHASRGVRWDSDHVVLVSDELRAIMQEIVRARCLERIHVGLDFFDASINRVAAWVTGTRATLKALLLALLEPAAELRQLEAAGDDTARLGLLEELKSMPFGAVWDYYCLKKNVPVGASWIAEVKEYEKKVLAIRASG